jgi:hypothetical protein
MRFADILLSSRKINVSNLNVKNRILRRSVTIVETSVYPPTALTDVEMLITKLILTNRLNHQTYPQINFYITNTGRNEYYNTLNYFKSSIEVLNSILCSPQN